MSIDPNVLRALVAAGATAEMLVAAVEAAAAAEEARKASKRANNAERQRRFKERKKEEQMTKGNADNALPSVTSVSNAELVPPSPDGPSSFPQTPNQHPLNPPSTSNDTGGMGAEIVVAFPKAKEPSQSRGTRLPADWKPSPDLIAFARQEGLTDEQISRELARFRDYWLQATGQRATKRDWDATFRNWIREAADRQRRFSRSSPSGNGTSAGSRFAAMQRAVARVSDQELFPE